MYIIIIKKKIPRVHCKQIYSSFKVTAIGAADFDDRRGLSAVSFQ